LDFHCFLAWEELIAYFPDTTRATLKTTRPTILLLLRVVVIIVLADCTVFVMKKIVKPDMITKVKKSVIMFYVTAFPL
jgi:hypothetical protein